MKEYLETRAMSNIAEAQTLSSRAKDLSKLVASMPTLAQPDENKARMPASDADGKARTNNASPPVPSPSAHPRTRARARARAHTHTHTYRSLHHRHRRHQSPPYLYL